MNGFRFDIISLILLSRNRLMERQCATIVPHFILPISLASIDTGVIPKSLPVLSTESILRKIAVKRGICMYGIGLVNSTGNR